jgi:hypothetical protein
MYAPYEGPDTLYGRGIEQVLNFSSVADPDLGSGDFGPLDLDAGSGIDFFGSPIQPMGYKYLTQIFFFFLYPGTC